MKKTITVKLEKEEWGKELDLAFKKVQQKASVDGFRKGKVPRDIYEKNYGDSDILYTAADKVINDRYKGVLEEAKMVPEIEPKIEIVKCDKEGLEVTYTLVAVSKVELGEYTNLGIKKKKVSVTKKEIEHEIEHILTEYAEIAEKDGKIEEGDHAIIDYEGFKDGVPFEGGKAENYDLHIGSKTFIPGFEEALIGLSKGESKDVELTFPKDYHSEELKGQKVVFKVTVNEVKQRIVPELTKEFFEDLAMPSVQTKEDLEKEIEKEIKEHKNHHAEEDYVKEVLETAVKNMKIDLEDEIVEQEAENMYQEFVENLKKQGINEELYFNYTGTTKETVIEELKKQAEVRIKNTFLLNEVVKTEKIEITDKEANAKVKEYATTYNIKEDQVLSEFGGIEVIKYDMMMNKALEIIKANK